MKFLWPHMLWLLAAVPALAALYVVILRRKKKAAARYASLAMVRDAIGASGRVRRHVPPVLFLAALALMIAAIARPTAIVMTPSQHRTVVLAIDVSGSMRAADVKPTRLAAAQAAAKAFAEEQPGHARIGVVSFAATASVVQAPTQNRDEIVAAIDRFQLQRGTATGSGLLVALATLLPDEGIDVSELTLGGSRPRGLPVDPAREAKKKAFKPVPPGSYTSGAIVLLSDGQRTAGPDPLQAAKMAAERGVRVFTVGIGTPKGEVLGFEGWSFRARLDEEALKAIANATRGEYYYAGNELELRKVYEALTSRLVFERKETEITAYFAAAAALLAAASAVLSMLWFNRIF